MKREKHRDQDLVLKRDIWLLYNTPSAWAELGFSGGGFTNPDVALPLHEVMGKIIHTRQPDNYRLITIALTLDEWTKIHQVDAHGHGDIMWVFGNDADKGRGSVCSLWHLTDYVVSSVSGGLVWLRPFVSKEAMF